MSAPTRSLILATVAVVSMLRPSALLAAPEPQTKPAAAPATPSSAQTNTGPAYKLDERMMRSIASGIGRTEADAREVAGVFRDERDGAQAVPVTVQLRAVDAHPPTYVRGEAIKLETVESGEVRERHWEIEPRVADKIHPAGAKGDRLLWWSSPSSGTYTVHVTVVGRQSGIATDKLTITLVDSAADVLAAASTGMPAPASAPAAAQKLSGGEDPTAVVKRALASVPAAARSSDLAHVRAVFARSNDLSEARAYLVRPGESLGAERLTAWLPFLDELEKLFDALRDAGRLPTAANVRGAMEEVARAME